MIYYLHGNLVGRRTESVRWIRWGQRSYREPTISYIPTYQSTLVQRHLAVLTSVMMSLIGHSSGQLYSSCDTSFYASELCWNDYVFRWSFCVSVCVCILVNSTFHKLRGGISPNFEFRFASGLTRSKGQRSRSQPHQIWPERWRHTH